MWPCCSKLRPNPDVHQSFFNLAKIPASSRRGLVERLDRVPAIVFVTANSTYAPRAFDVAALDFLIKPVEPQRLALTVERLRQYRRATRKVLSDSISFDSLKS